MAFGPIEICRKERTNACIHPSGINGEMSVFILCSLSHGFRNRQLCSGSGRRFRLADRPDSAIFGHSARFSEEHSNGGSTFVTDIRSLNVEVAVRPNREHLATKLTVVAAKPEHKRAD
jgi:hypothetical protein